MSSACWTSKRKSADPAFTEQFKTALDWGAVFILGRAPAVTIVPKQKRLFWAAVIFLLPFAAMPSGAEDVAFDVLHEYTLANGERWTWQVTYHEGMTTK